MHIYIYIYIYIYTHLYTHIERSPRPLKPLSVRRIFFPSLCPRCARSPDFDRFSPPLASSCLLISSPHLISSSPHLLISSSPHLLISSSPHLLISSSPHLFLFSSPSFLRCHFQPSYPFWPLSSSPLSCLRSPPKLSCSPQIYQASSLSQVPPFPLARKQSTMQARTAIKEMRASTQIGKGQMGSALMGSLQFYVV